VQTYARTGYLGFLRRTEAIGSDGGQAIKYSFNILTSSVADPGSLSRIPDPDFYPFRIPDPKTATKERGEKKFVVNPFL
jgi:hypothetical protein